MDGVFAVRAALIMAGLAFGAAARARYAGELDRPVLLLGFAGMCGSLAAAAAGGGWSLAIVAALGVLGYVLALANRP